MISVGRGWRCDATQWNEHLRVREIHFVNEMRLCLVKYLRQTASVNLSYWKWAGLSHRAGEALRCNAVMIAQGASYDCLWQVMIASGKLWDAPHRYDIRIFVLKNVWSHTISVEVSLCSTVRLYFRCFTWLLFFCHLWFFTCFFLLGLLFWEFFRISLNCIILDIFEKPMKKCRCKTVTNPHFYFEVTL